MRPSFESTHPGLNRYQRSRWLWILFLVSALTAIGMFFVPAFIIRPFRHQAPSGLLLAMSLRQRAPLFTLVLALACFIMSYALWRISSRWGKSVLALAMLAVTFSAVMARLNYFEWMFHPIAGPQFLAQSESKLDPKEMIMAVRVAGDARAYPISQMAYHHVLNDVVGGVPIAVTY
jgi:heme/copper-type cytochrome/quinol oxidase subunit 3